MLQYRSEQLGELKSDDAKTLGDVVTLNLTALRSGVTTDGGKTYALNVIPTDAMAGFDVRVTPLVDIRSIQSKLEEWTAEEGVSFEFVLKLGENSLTPLTADNVWWTTFKSVCDSIKLTLKPQIFPASTDSKYLRAVGIPAFGFSPMNNTTVLMHDHNEALHEDVFVKGIEIYEHIIKGLASKEVFESKQNTAVKRTIPEKCDLDTEEELKKAANGNGTKKHKCAHAH
eukprot:GFYU01004543.1.p1 GENE.GFYU01004543.1~~GFYU01004543.1.p1  ORF type:complete len:244 (-),score=96.60 GFYU01004543.1:101-784(-)